MTDPQERTFTGDFKRFFLRGLVVLLPSLLTLWLLVYAYQFINTAIAAPVNEGVRIAITKLTPSVPFLRQRFEPTESELDAALSDRPSTTGQPIDRNSLRAELRRNRVIEWWVARWYMDLIGLVIAIVGVYIAGRLVGGFLGRSIYRRLERLITRIPVLKQVYPSVKQVVDFFFSEDKQMRFSHVVIVEYPRLGVWSLGFLTGEPLPGIACKTGDTVTVYIPSSPAPFTGYTIMAPRSHVIDVDVTVDEALRFVVSAGVLTPSRRPVARDRNLPESEAGKVGKSLQVAGVVGVADDPASPRSPPAAITFSPSPRQPLQ